MHKLDVAAVSRRVFGVLLDGRLLWRATGTWFVLLIVIGWSIFALEPWAAGDVVAKAVYHVWATLAGVVELAAFAACAVNVHRSILLAEHPVPIRFSRTEWRYFWRGIWVTLPLILLIAAVAMLSFVFVPSISDILKGMKNALAAPWWSYAHALAWLGAEMTGGIVVAPLFMSLPAVAIGRIDFTMSDGVEAISGNFLRLLAIYLIACSVPVTIVALIADRIGNGIAIFAAQPLFTFKAIEIVVEVGREILDVVIWAAMLSCAYAGLVERDREHPTPP